jgi:hypothetical protein
MKKYVSGKEYLGLVVGEEEVMDPFFPPIIENFLTLQIPRHRKNYITLRP